MSRRSSTVAALIAVLLRELSETGKASVGDRSFLIGAMVDRPSDRSIILTILGVSYHVTVEDEDEI